MRSQATSQPFTAPQAAPVAMPTSNASSSDPVVTATSARDTDASDSTAPIDRSSPSVMITSVIGSAISSSTLDCASTLDRLGHDRKPGLAQAKPTLTTASITTTPGMRTSSG